MLSSTLSRSCRQGSRSGSSLSSDLGGTVGSPLGGYGVQLPVVRDAFELMAAAIVKRELGACDEVDDSAADQNLAGFGVFRNPRADMHSCTDEVVAARLDLPCVDTGADLQADGAERISNGACGANRSGGAVEGSEEAIAEAVDNAAIETGDLGADQVVVLSEQRGPTFVPEPRHRLSRPDDIREEDSRENAVRLLRSRGSGQERLDLVEQLVWLTGQEGVSISGEFQVARAGNVVC